jgi:hypothetical protein
LVPIYEHMMGRWEPQWGRQRGSTNSWSRSHPPCGDESGGEVTGQGRAAPHEVSIGVVNHVIVAIYVTPHVCIIMWNGLGGILVIQKCLLFLNLGTGLVKTKSSGSSRSMGQPLLDLVRQTMMRRSERAHWTGVMG